MAELSTLAEYHRMVLIVNRGLSSVELLTFIINILKVPYVVLSQNVLPGLIVIDPRTPLEQIPLEYWIFSTEQYFPASQLARRHFMLVLEYGFLPDVANGVMEFLDPEVILRGLQPATQTMETQRIEVLMSRDQVEEYRRTRGQEISVQKAAKSEALTSTGEASPKLWSPKMRRGKYEADIGLHALERANFLYPAQLQVEYNKESKERARLPQDFLAEQGGWITQEVLANLALFSPKFLRILNDLETNKKYLMVTRFKNHHGLYLLNSFLQIIGRQTFLLSGDTPKHQIPAIINTFVTTPAAILLMTSALQIEQNIPNVDVIIFVDGTDTRQVNYLLNKVFRYENYPQAHHLLVKFYISRISEQYASVDLEYFKEFQEQEQRRETAFQILAKYAHDIKWQGKLLWF